MVLKYLFSLILILLFVKDNLVKLSVAAIIGAVIGTFFEIKKEPTYGADLQVQPNFKSTRQLYNNVNYYNDLVKQKDTVSLANAFNISVNEASSLKKFTIYPVKN